MAIVCGIAWGLIANFINFLFLNLLLGAGVGYAIGEVVSLSVNRKRSRWLATVAGIGVAISYLVSLLLPLLLGLFFGWFHILDLLALALGIFIAVNRLR